MMKGEVRSTAQIRVWISAEKAAGHTTSLALAIIPGVLTIRLTRPTSFSQSFQHVFEIL